MGIIPNENNDADIFGFEMKKQTKAKTTFGDWTANYYLFKDTKYNLTRDYYSDDCDSSTFFNWPKASMETTKVGDILEDLSDLSVSDDKFTISDKLWAGHKRRKQQHQQRGNGFGYSLYTPDDAYTNTISARYYKDGSEILIDQSKLEKNPRKLTPRECANLQGFPKEFIVNAVSNTQIYKQFGNSVCVSVIRVVAEQIYKTMKNTKAQLNQKAVKKELGEINLL